MKYTASVYSNGLTLCIVGGKPSGHETQSRETVKTFSYAKLLQVIDMEKKEKGKKSFLQLLQGLA